LEQLKQELEPLLHFDIKRVGQGNEYRGYPIKIVEPAPKDKVVFTPLLRPSRAIFDGEAMKADNSEMSDFMTKTFRGLFMKPSMTLRIKKVVLLDYWNDLRWRKRKVVVTEEKPNPKYQQWEDLRDSWMKQQLMVSWPRLDSCATPETLREEDIYWHDQRRTEMLKAENRVLRDQVVRFYELKIAPDPVYISKTDKIIK